MAENTTSLAELALQHSAALKKLADRPRPASPTDRPQWWREQAESDREIAGIYRAMKDTIVKGSELDALDPGVVATIWMALDEAAYARDREARQDEEYARGQEAALRAAGSAGA